MRLLLVTLLAALLVLPACQKCQGPIGTWEGRLKVPTGELTIVFHITSDSAGRLTATMDSPDQGATGIAVDSVTFADRNLTLKVTSIGGTYEGTMRPDDKSIGGKWKQGPFSLPLEMRRAGKLAEVKRPQEPKPPYPYKEEEVTVQNPAAGITLAGTLTLPDSGGPFPSVVLITGSGAEDRNEAVFGHKPFLVLADYLTRRGIAVLRCDDRGAGRSTGDYGAATTADLATDALAQVAYLKTRSEIDPERIGLLGHSEGGIIAPLAANQSKDVAFVVLMAGTGVRGDSLLVLQAALVAKSQGIPDSGLAAIRAAQRRVLNVLFSKLDTASMAARLRSTIKDAVSMLNDTEKEAFAYSEAAIEQQVKSVMSPWFRYFVAYDPAPALHRLRVPVLAVVGERDVQVAPGENLGAIEAALRAGGNPDYTVRELPGLNHLLQHATTGAITEYAKTEETIAPEALQLFGDWILGRAASR